jgi:hypothetical protein
LYKEQATLEREYAGKLQALARKAAERKSKVEAIVVGEEPTKTLDDRVIMQKWVLAFFLVISAVRLKSQGTKSTLVKAYTVIISSTTSAADDHVNVADAINTQVVQVLKALEKKNESMMKKVRLSLCIFFSRFVISFHHKGDAILQQTRF